MMKRELTRLIIILYAVFIILGTLYGLGGIDTVLGTFGLLVGLPIFGLILWGIYRFGYRLHWWG